MFYGEPSSACRTCREARVKCDCVKPKCTRCDKRNLECIDDAESHRVEVEVRRQAFRKRIKDRKRNQAASSSASPGSSRGSSATPSQNRSLSPTSVTDFDSPIGGDLILLQRISPEGPEVATLLDRYVNAHSHISPSSSFGSLYRHIPRISKQSDNDSAANLLFKASALFPYCIPLATRKKYMPIALEFYGQALSRLKEDLADPVQSKKTETLHAIVAMYIFDDARSTVLGHDLPALEWHINGIQAIVHHRKDANFQDEHSKDLFNVARCMMHAEMNIEQIEALLPKQAPPGAKKPPPSNNQYVELSGLQAYYHYNLRMALSFHHSLVPPSAADLQGLYYEVERLLLLLDVWLQSCPDFWAPKPAWDVSPPTLQKFDAYEARIDIYEDPFVIATIMPHLYTVIGAQKLGIELLQELLARITANDSPSVSSHDSRESSHIMEEADVRARLVYQQEALVRTIDSLLSILPALIGSRKSMLDADVEYPSSSPNPPPSTYVDSMALHARVFTALNALRRIWAAGVGNPAQRAYIVRKHNDLRAMLYLPPI